MKYFLFITINRIYNILKINKKIKFKNYENQSFVK